MTRIARLIRKSIDIYENRWSFEKQLVEEPIDCRIEEFVDTIYTGRYTDDIRHIRVIVHTFLNHLKPPTARVYYSDVFSTGSINTDVISVTLSDRESKMLADILKRKCNRLTTVDEQKEMNASALHKAKKQIIEDEIAAALPPNMAGWAYTISLLVVTAVTIFLLWKVL